MRAASVVFLVTAVVVAAGCGTTRVTDTQRAASEMLLVSQAVDNAIGQINLSALNGKTVFLDTQYLDQTVDKGYVISSLRQHLLAHGAMLQETREKAGYVVEVRAGAVGTDKHSLLIGTPQMSLPAVVPGIPTAVPEIALVKRTDQKGVAKLAVFAYNRLTGRALWQSGLVEANSTLEDTWVFGAGPISGGSIRREREFAGQEIPKLPLPFADGDEERSTAEPASPAPAAQAAVFSGSERPAPPVPIPVGVIAITGATPAVGREVLGSAPPGPLHVTAPIAPPAGPIVTPVGNIQPPSGPVPKSN